MIPFLDLGGRGQDLVFLHANGFPPECYQPLLDRLMSASRTRAMLQRPLWPGQRPPDLDDWNILSQDLLTFLDEQNLADVIAVGHSMGAIAALRAALWSPNKFSALILLEPVLLPMHVIWEWRIVRAVGLGKRVHPLIPGALKRQRTFESRDAAFERYRGRPIFRYFSDEALRAYIAGMTERSRDSGFVLRYSPEWEAQVYDAGIWNDGDLWRGLPGLRPPTLIVRGAKSDTLREGVTRDAARASPQVRIAVLDRATHLVPLERPNETFELIQSFLSAVESAGVPRLQ